MDGWKITLLADEIGVGNEMINEDVEEEMLLQEGLEAKFILLIKMRKKFRIMKSKKFPIK